ncbi:S24 family peptidase [Priestia koreensis]|uniref:S24 family peptidase n=1 Tax=Priestia koreensis TaxID=284581 RepID=UPI00301A1082
MTIELIGYEVIGSEMEPSMIDGDMVWVDFSEEPEANAQDIALIEVDGQSHVCRYTFYGQQVLMIHDNGPISVVKRDRVTILGKIVSRTGM